MTFSILKTHFLKLPPKFVTYRDFSKFEVKEIKKLNLNKAVQNSDIPVKILKENIDFFADYTDLQFNEAVD